MTEIYYFTIKIKNCVLLCFQKQNVFLKTNTELNY